ncbi:MAG TPA: ATP synthase F1 subunit delta [Thermoanaerobaculia bacterium]|jgi:F-type H+-transporting ATPase subunit delta|nr:ATP synthase F1 subunit delta [Thermoanaerobaculia bacterium]
MSTAFALPYARAFLEAAPKSYDIAAFLAAGETMAAAFAANPKLRAFVLAPNVPRDAKSKAIAALSAKAGLDEYGARFLQLMLRNHRLLEASAVFRTLRDLHDEKRNILRVRVSVPAALTDAQKKKVEDAIARRTGKTVISQIEIDPALLGGFVARAGSRVYDGSVSAAIRRFETTVIEKTGA